MSTMINMSEMTNNADATTKDAAREGQCYSILPLASPAVSLEDPSPNLEDPSPNLEDLKPSSSPPDEESGEDQTSVAYVWKTIHTSDYFFHTQAWILMSCIVYFCGPGYGDMTGFDTYDPEQKWILMTNFVLFLTWQILFWLHKFLSHLNMPHEYIRNALPHSRASVKFILPASSLLAFLAMKTFLEDNSSLKKLREGPRYSRASYFLLILAFIAVTFHTRKLVRVKQAPASKSLSAEWSTFVCNRDQTEEWKGWLQFAFIIYHYMGASEAVVYFPIRVCVGTYVWLTGFGNTLYFIQRRDYSLRRVTKMLMRLNLFVLVYMRSINILYKIFYIVPMHTTYFLMVYLILGICESKNDTSRFLVPVKLWLTFCILTVIHVLTPDASDEAFIYLKIKQEFLGPFRFHLDGYATWFGMCCASVFLFFKHKPSRLEPFQQRFHSRTVVLICLLVWGVWAALTIKSQERPEYLLNHKWTSLLPILTFAVCRNATSNLRRWYIPPVAWFGRLSLETYLLQVGFFFTNTPNRHYVWNSAYPLFTLLLNLAVTVYFAQLAHEGTGGVTNFLVPSNKSWLVIVLTRWLPVVALLALTRLLASL